MSFADRLRAVRKKKGLTQEAVALASGFPGQSRIGNYESKKSTVVREPSLDEVVAIARALGVSSSVLIDQAAFDAWSQTEAESQNLRTDHLSIDQAVEEILARVEGRTEPFTAEELLAVSKLTEALKRDSSSSDNSVRNLEDAANSRRSRSAGSGAERKDGLRKNRKA